jgi:hypothetical protein
MWLNVLLNPFVLSRSCDHVIFIFKIFYYKNNNLQSIKKIYLQYFLKIINIFYQIIYIYIYIYINLIVLKSNKFIILNHFYTIVKKLYLYSKMSL